MKAKLISSNLLTKVLWRISGADIGILKQLPSEQIRYQLIGSILLIQTIITLIVNTYLWNIIFQNLYLIFIGSLLITFLVFNINRFSLSTINNRKGDQSKAFFVNYIVPMSLRLILSISLSIFNALILNLIIFKQEINQSIYDKKQKYVIEISDKVAKNNVTIASINAKISIQNLLVDLYRYKINQEIKGLSSSNQIGFGPITLEKEMDAALKSRDSLKIQILTLKKDNELKNELMNNIKRKNIKTDLLSYISELHDLQIKNNTIMWFNLILIMFCIIMEISPLLIKIQIKDSEYDSLLKRKESSKFSASVSALENAYMQALDSSNFNPGLLIEKEKHGNPTSNK